MRFSEADGRKVVSTTTATTIGRVAGFAVDPSTQQVVALQLKKTDGDADTVLWSALTAFGVDAVTVPGPEVFVVADGETAVLLDKHHSLKGKRVLTEGGDDLGKVEDLEFDAETGSVTLLITKTKEIAGKRLTGVGSYAVVVRHA